MRSGSSTKILQLALYAENYSILLSTMCIWQSFLMEEGIVCIIYVCPHVCILIFLCILNLCNLYGSTYFSEGAMEFSISLIQALVVEDSKVVSELHNLVDALAKVFLSFAALLSRFF